MKIKDIIAKLEAANLPLSDENGEEIYPDDETQERPGVLAEIGKSEKPIGSLNGYVAVACIKIDAQGIVSQVYIRPCLYVWDLIDCALFKMFEDYAKMVAQ